MREIRLTLPRGAAPAVFALAREAGLTEARVKDVRLLGRDELAEEVTLKSSSPQIREFLRLLLSSPRFGRGAIRFSVHEALALVDDEPTVKVTVPASVPMAEVAHDLWRYCHVTASFVARTCVSASLLAYAMLKADTLLVVGSLIFTPFSPLVLSVAFGISARNGELTRRALLVLAAALVLTVTSAAGTAALVGGPLHHGDFGSPMHNLGASAMIGVMAALADADEVGRRQLLGLAMAYPFVRLTVWLGLALALGAPADEAPADNLLLLAGNAGTMTAAAAVTYRMLGHRGELEGLPR